MKKPQAGKQQEQEEITFPYTYTQPKCSVSVKIYKTPRGNYDGYTVVYYKDGERKRIMAKSFEAALEEAKAATTFLGSANGDVLLESPKIFFSPFVALSISEVHSSQINERTSNDILRIFCIPAAIQGDANSPDANTNTAHGCSSHNPQRSP